MLMDALLLFSNAQAITANAASTSHIDLSQARSIGTGMNLYVVTVITTALADSGSNSTVTVDLQYDSTTTFTPDQSQTLYSLGAVAAAGTIYAARIAPEVTNYRYVQLYYTMVNGDLSSGNVTSFITTGIHKYTNYADALVIT